MNRTKTIIQDFDNRGSMNKQTELTNVTESKSNDYYSNLIKNVVDSLSKSAPKMTVDESLGKAISKRIPSEYNYFSDFDNYNDLYDNAKESLDNTENSEEDYNTKREFSRDVRNWSLIVDNAAALAEYHYTFSSRMKKHDEVSDKIMDFVYKATNK